MVVNKDRPLGPGRSVLMIIVVECEDHSAIQAPQSKAKIELEYFSKEEMKKLFLRRTLFHLPWDDFWQKDKKITSKKLSDFIRWRPPPVWPDLSKFRHLGNI